METKARQETAVGEGLALGVLAEGIAAMSANPMAVEPAFRRAWRDWPYAGQFPVVRASFRRNDIMRIIYMSPRRVGPIAAWERERGLRPYRVMDQFTLDEAGEMLEEFYGVPWSAWRDLARAFLAGFKEGETIADHSLTD